MTPQEAALVAALHAEIDFAITIITVVGIAALFLYGLIEYWGMRQMHKYSSIRSAQIKALDEASERAYRNRR